MANRDFKTIQALQRGLKIICGSFAPNGTSQPTDVKGLGFQVERTNQGEFTVTLDDKFVDLVSGHCTLQVAVGTDTLLQLSPIDVVSAKTVVIKAYNITAAGLVDIAADPSNRIHFALFLRNSTVL